MKSEEINQKELQKVKEEIRYQDQNQSLIGQNQYQNNIQEIESTYWDVFSNRYLKMKIQTTFTQEKQLVYSKDGLIIRIDNIKDYVTDYELMENVEQIKYLYWYGKYGQSNQKIGNWMACWKEEVLINVGGYYRKILYSKDGLKQGLWKQLIRNYWSKAQVYEAGEYHNGSKRGNWNLIYNFKEIGSGSYNEQGKKNGKWIELSDGFWKKCQVTYHGEYNNGKKVGGWDIFFHQDGNNNKLELIGGGQYAEKQDDDGFVVSVKNGRWIELGDRFWNENKVFYNGQYKNGKKFGRWDIFMKQGGTNKDFELIGGGFYEDDGFGNSIKIGWWVELSEEFWEKCQVTQNGEYQNGIKFGRWDTIWIWKKKMINEKIGGGSYKDNGYGNSVKIGNWIELSANFGQYKQLTYNGKYQNDKKVGRWNIFFRLSEENQNFELMQDGGGLYVDHGAEGSSVKTGKWIELSNSFWDQSEVTYHGVYEDDIKIGRWDIYFKDILSKRNQLIGGGLYDEKQVSSSVKIGNWIELSDGYRWSDQVTLHGEYQYGKKFGRWDLFYKKGGEQKAEFKLIGGGQYEIKKGNNCFIGSIKTGRWIELSDEFWNQSDILYDGDYINGQKIGKWNIYYKDIITKKVTQMQGKNSYIIKSGSGQYSIKQSENGFIGSLKTGRWIVLVDEFMWNNQITYIGEFQGGKKVGKWNTMDLQRKGNRKMQNYINIYKKCSDEKIYDNWQGENK